MVQEQERFDYLVIFGAAVRSDGTPSGTLRRRVEEAFKDGKRRGAARFLVTGGLCRYPPAEATVMHDLLLELGASVDQIVIEDTARNTLQSAVRCAALLRQREDVGAVVVCSSSYHIRRCRMLLRMNGIRPAASVASRDGLKVGLLRSAYSWLREGAAFPLDAAIMVGRHLGKVFVSGRPKPAGPD